MIKLNLDKLEKSVSPIFDRKTIMEQYGISISTLNRWTREHGFVRLQMIWDISG